MKKLFIILLLPLALFSGYAQNNALIPIYVGELTYNVQEQEVTAGDVIVAVLDAVAGYVSENRHPEYISSVNAMVKTAISGVRRLSPVVPEAATLNLSGEITSITTTTSNRSVERRDSKGRPYTATVLDYSASVAVTMTLMEQSTGEQWTNSFSGSSAWYDNARSESAAINLAIERLQESIVKYYNNMFPLSATIIEVNKTKKDRVQEVYIDLGAMSGINENSHFTVFALGNVAGKEIRKEIGKLRVTKVMGDEISLCKVTDGGKDIKTAIDEGTTLLVVSND